MTVDRLPSEVIAAIKLFTVEDADGFLFAVFSSSMMLTWQKLVGGRLKSDPSFANTLVWNTFPMPIVDAGLRRDVIDAGQEVLAVRSSLAPKSLAVMYEPGSMDAGLIAAHAHLDRVIDQVFDLAERPNLAQRQQRLFDLYVEMTGDGQLQIATHKSKRSRRPVSK